MKKPLKFVAAAAGLAGIVYIGQAWTTSRETAPAPTPPQINCGAKGKVALQNVGIISPENRAVRFTIRNSAVTAHVGIDVLLSAVNGDDKVEASNLQAVRSVYEPITTILPNEEQLQEDYIDPQSFSPLKTGSPVSVTSFDIVGKKTTEHIGIRVTPLAHAAGQATVATVCTQHAS